MSAAEQWLEIARLRKALDDAEWERRGMLGVALVSRDECDDLRILLRHSDEKCEAWREYAAALIHRHVLGIGPDGFDRLADARARLIALGEDLNA